jgi:Ca2+-binding EF-hand superfamily protein
MASYGSAERYGSGGYSQQLYGGGGGGYGGGDRYGGGGYGGGGYGHAGRYDRYDQPVGGYGQHGSSTHDVPTDVRDCFNRFDTNGSGKMDYRELRNCLVALGGVDISHQGAADILLRYDRDGNGVLDVEEFSVIVKRLREVFTGQSYGGGAENRQIRGNISYEVRAVFEKFDENRSGKLDYRQLGSALRSMGMSADSNQAADIIKKFDTDNNGLMELDEFNTLVWKLRETLYPQVRVRVGVRVSVGVRVRVRVRVRIKVS